LLERELLGSPRVWETSEIHDVAKELLIVELLILEYDCAEDELENSRYVMIILLFG
jgi:hypothetical protein